MSANKHRMLEVLRQFALYGAAGGAAVATHLAVLGVLVEWAGADKTAASTAGFLCVIEFIWGRNGRLFFLRTVNCPCSEF